MTTLNLETRAGRCAHGFALPEQASLHSCDASEWSIFTSAIKRAVRDDGTIHLCDVRPLIRGRIEPKHIGQMWRRARTDGLVRDTGEREESNDVAGRNTDKLDRIYALGRAA